MGDMSPWLLLLAAAILGLGLGTGLVLAAFVVRALRHYMRDEGFNGGNHRQEKS